MEYLLLICIIFPLAAFPLAKCKSHDQVRLSRHQSCDYIYKTWVICRGLTTIPYHVLPNSTIFLELTASKFGSILRHKEVAELEYLLLLHNLYLTNNSLEFIEDNAFMNLNNLTTLDISDNHIEGFNEGTFFGLMNLIYLHASDNLISSISPLSFTAVPFLQYLNLERNNLTSIGSEFAFLAQLTTLLLANNQIVAIDSGAFHGLSSLWHLSLFGNKLTIPESSWFYGILENEGKIELDKRINSLIADPNPWICCSSILLYRNFVKTLNKNVDNESELDIKCSAPSNLYNRSISTLAVNDIASITCPVASNLRSYYSNSGSRHRTNSATVSKGKVLAQDRDVPVSPVDDNFLWNLNNLEISLLLVFFALVGGGAVGAVCCLFHTKQRKLTENDLETPDSSTAKSTTRLFRQDFPSYGVSDPVSRTQQNLWFPHQLVVPRQVLSSPEIDDSILPKSLEYQSNGIPPSFYIEPDNSDAESWVAVDRRRSKE